ncbi:Cobalt-precorrin-5B C(1)-methyltransferase [Dirofilaria immitis]
MSEQVLWQGETEEVGMSKHYGSVEGDTRKETPTPMPSSFLLRVCVWLQTLLPVVKMCVIHSKPMNHPCATFPSDASLCGNSDKKLSLMTSTLETDLFNNEQCQCDIHHGRR